MDTGCQDFGRRWSEAGIPSSFTQRSVECEMLCTSTSGVVIRTSIIMDRLQGYTVCVSLVLTIYQPKNVAVVEASVNIIHYDSWKSSTLTGRPTFDPDASSKTCS